MSEPRPVQRGQDVRQDGPRQTADRPQAVPADPAGHQTVRAAVPGTDGGRAGQRAAEGVLGGRRRQPRRGGALLRLPGGGDGDPRRPGDAAGERPPTRRNARQDAPRGGGESPASETRRLTGGPTLRPRRSALMVCARRASNTQSTPSGPPKTVPPRFPALTHAPALARSLRVTQQRNRLMQDRLAAPAEQGKSRPKGKPETGFATIPSRRFLDTGGLPSAPFAGHVAPFASKEGRNRQRRRLAPWGMGCDCFSWPGSERCHSERAQRVEESRRGLAVRGFPQRDPSTRSARSG